MSSESNIQSLFETALKEYEKQAGTNLLDSHLITRLQSCNSVDEISTVLQEHTQTFHKFRGSDGRVISWLKRTIHVLHTLSTSSVLGAGVGLVRYKLFALTCPSQDYLLTRLTRIQPFPPANAIFAG